MIKCEHCGNSFINKACVTKHLNNKRCPNYVPPPTYKEIEAKNTNLQKIISHIKTWLSIIKNTGTEEGLKDLPSLAEELSKYIEDNDG